MIAFLDTNTILELTKSHIYEQMSWYKSWWKFIRNQIKGDSFIRHEWNTQ